MEYYTDNESSHYTVLNLEVIYLLSVNMNNLKNETKASATTYRWSTN